jgi:hypothetical protein
MVTGQDAQGTADSLRDVLAENELGDLLNPAVNADLVLAYLAERIPEFDKHFPGLGMAGGKVYLTSVLAALREPDAGDDESAE